MTVSLVTGADGFVGQHLVAALLARGDDVVGGIRDEPPALTTLSADRSERVRWMTFDLERPDSVRALVRGAGADRVFHLAGLSSVAESLDDHLSPMRVNALGTQILLHELMEMGSAANAAAVVVSGSADAYGASASRVRPLTEDAPLEPLNAYAVSKAAQELIALQAYRASGLPVIVTRSFNHIGPGQRSVFVAPQLASQVAAIREAGAGVKGKVRVGNPLVRRDFTDVRDVVRAYLDLSERGQAGEVYNVCSGKSYSIGELVTMLAELAGISVEITTDPSRARSRDVMEVEGSCDRLASRTGWRAAVDVRKSLADLLDAEVGRVRAIAATESGGA